MSCHRINRNRGTVRPAQFGRNVTAGSTSGLHRIIQLSRCFLQHPEFRVTAEERFPAGSAVSVPLLFHIPRSGSPAIPALSAVHRLQYAARHCVETFRSRTSLGTSEYTPNGSRGAGARSSRAQRSRFRISAARYPVSRAIFDSAAGIDIPCDAARNARGPRALYRPP